MRRRVVAVATAARACSSSTTIAVALRTSGSHFDDGTNNRQVAFFVNQAQVTPDSTVTNFTALPTANANTRVQFTTSRRNKVNTTVTYVPKLEYKRDDVTLTLAATSQRVVWGSAADSERKATVLAALLGRYAGAGAGEYDVSAPGIAVFRAD